MVEVGVATTGLVLRPPSGEGGSDGRRDLLGTSLAIHMLGLCVCVCVCVRACVCVSV